MKKNFLLILVMLFTCFLFACNSKDEKAKDNDGYTESENHIVTFIGTIEEITNQKSALINVEEGGILKSSNKVFVDLTVNTSETFQIGDKVKVGFDGKVLESYPAQIKTLSVERVE